MTTRPMQGDYYPIPIFLGHDESKPGSPRPKIPGAGFGNIRVVGDALVADLHGIPESRIEGYPYISVEAYPDKQVIGGMAMLGIEPWHPLPPLEKEKGTYDHGTGSYSFPNWPIFRVCERQIGVDQTGQPKNFEFDQNWLKTAAENAQKRECDADFFRDLQSNFQRDRETGTVWGWHLSEEEIMPNKRQRRKFAKKENRKINFQDELMLPPEPDIVPTVDELEENAALKEDSMFEAMMGRLDDIEARLGTLELTDEEAAAEEPAPEEEVPEEPGLEEEAFAMDEEEVVEEDEEEEEEDFGAEEEDDTKVEDMIADIVGNKTAAVESARFSRRLKKLEQRQRKSERDINSQGELVVKSEFRRLRLQIEPVAELYQRKTGGKIIFARKTVMDKLHQGQTLEQITADYSGRPDDPKTMAILKSRERVDFGRDLDGYAEQLLESFKSNPRLYRQKKAEMLARVKDRS